MDEPQRRRSPGCAWASRKPKAGHCGWVAKGKPAMGEGRNRRKGRNRTVGVRIITGGVSCWRPTLGTHKSGGEEKRAAKALCGQVCRQTGGITQNGEAVRAGDTEAISVGEDAAPEPRVYGADSGQEEEAPIQVVMGRLVNRDSARAPEPLHRGWEFRAAEGAVQDDPIRGPERPSGTGGHCTRIKKVWRVDQPHSNTFPTQQANQAGGSWTEAPQCK